MLRDPETRTGCACIPGHRHCPEGRTLWAAVASTYERAMYTKHPAHLDRFDQAKAAYRSHMDAARVPA